MSEELLAYRKMTAEERDNIDISIYTDSLKDSIKTFAEEKTGNPNASIFPIVKKVLLNTTGKIPSAGAKADLMLRAEAMAYIITEVCGLTPEQYVQGRTTKLNRDLKINHLVSEIYALAPMEIKKECCFIQGLVAIAVVFPELFQKNFDAITPIEVYHCKGELKGALAHAGKISNNNVRESLCEKEIEKEKKEEKKERTPKTATPAIQKKINCGKEVDEILFDALTYVLEEKTGMSPEEVFNYLANYKKNSTLSGHSPAGIYQVIEARECYPSPLDFYFLNQAVEFQIQYMDVYMEVRKAAKIPTLPILNQIYEVFKEDRECFEDIIHEKEHQIDYDAARAKLAQTIIQNIEQMIDSPCDGSTRIKCAKIANAYDFKLGISSNHYVIDEKVLKLDAEKIAKQIVEEDKLLDSGLGETR